LDQAIQEAKIRPFIFVIPDNYTLFEGSFYTNSALTGNWEAYNTAELISLIDSRYKTIAKKKAGALQATPWEDTAHSNSPCCIQNYIALCMQ